jgi:hypothetical protein
MVKINGQYDPDDLRYCGQAGVYYHPDEGEPTKGIY